MVPGAPWAQRAWGGRGPPLSSAPYKTNSFLMFFKGCNFRSACADVWGLVDTFPGLRGSKLDLLEGPCSDLNLKTIERDLILRIYVLLKFTFLIFWGSQTIEKTLGFIGFATS